MTLPTLRLHDMQLVLYSRLPAYRQAKYVPAHSAGEGRTRPGLLCIPDRCVCRLSARLLRTLGRSAVQHRPADLRAAGSHPRAERSPDVEYVDCSTDCRRINTPNGYRALAAVARTPPSRAGRSTELKNSCLRYPWQCLMSTKSNPSACARTAALTKAPITPRSRYRLASGKRRSGCRSFGQARHTAVPAEQRLQTTPVRRTAGRYRATTHGLQTQRVF